MADWEFTYNGLTFGGGNDIRLMNIEGLSPPDSRVDDIERADDHGSFIFAEYLEPRRITLEGDIMADDAATFASLVNDWRAAFVPQEEPQALSFLIPGEEQRRIYCVPTRRHFPVESFEYENFFVEWSLELLAQDPRIYSDILNAESVGPATEDGVTFDVTFDVNFGGGIGGETTLVNDGIFPTRPVAVIHGPVVDPTLRNLTAGKAISFTITLGENDELTVDFDARTVLLNGTSNRYNTLDSDSEWWELAAGNNQVKYQGSTPEGSQVTFSWRDSWI